MRNPSEPRSPVYSRHKHVHQSGQDHGDGMRALNLKVQKPEDDQSCEPEHRTNLGRIFLPLCRCAEAWVEEGIRPQEAEATASSSGWYKVTMRIRQLCMELRPGNPILLYCLISRLPTVRRMLHEMCCLRIH